MTLFADQRAKNRCVCADIAVPADTNARADHGARADHRPGAYFDVRSDHRQRVDHDAVLEMG